MDDIIIEAVHETYKIEKQDDRNLVLKRLNSKGNWPTWGFYGRLTDMAEALLRLDVQSPESDDLLAAVRELQEQIIASEKAITSALAELA